MISLWEPPPPRQRPTNQPLHTSQEAAAATAAAAGGTPDTTTLEAQRDKEAAVRERMPAKARAVFERVSSGSTSQTLTCNLTLTQVRCWLVGWLGCCVFWWGQGEWGGGGGICQSSKSPHGHTNPQTHHTTPTPRKGPCRRPGAGGDQELLALGREGRGLQQHFLRGTQALGPVRFGLGCCWLVCLVLFCFAFGVGGC